MPYPKKDLAMLKEDIAVMGMPFTYAMPDTGTV